MKCPLLRSQNFGTPYDPGKGQLDCLKEECAWWDTTLEECCVLSIFTVLENITLKLRDIRDKMPSPEFFKK